MLVKIRVPILISNSRTFKDHTCTILNDRKNTTKLHDCTMCLKKIDTLFVFAIT